MENIKSLNMEKEYENFFKRENRISAIRVEKRQKYLSLKKKLIGINICATILLIMMLVVGYSEMVGINSNKNIISAENNDYKIEINSLEDIVTPYRSTERIRSIATTKLEMVVPKSEHIVKLEDKGIKVEASHLDGKSKWQNSKTNVFSIFSNIFR